jgi:hypothetical protein
MHIVLEYILRKGRVEQLLNLPCSLFLENAGKKLVVTLQPRYATNGICVRHYPLWKITKCGMMPTFEEFVITLDEVFKHSSVIVPGYKLLEFTPQSFTSEEKQVNDLPLAAIQERQYKECLITYFSPKMMNRTRENWLWTCFDDMYVNVGVNIGVHAGFWNYKPEVQREHIKRDKNKAIYKVWELWKKNLLLNSDPASELVFAKYYDSQFLKYIPPEPTEEEKMLLEVPKPKI